MAETRLGVRLAERRVGHIDRNRFGLLSWVPDADWLADDQHPRLGLDFLRQPGVQQSTHALPVWFENLLPERDSALRAALCRQWSLPDHDDLGLLATLGGDLPGAVRVVAAPHAPLPIPATLSADPHDDRWRFSLAGMQLKLSMGQQGHRFAVSTSDGEEAWIVKLPGRDLPDLPQVEHATMAWARAAGFPVPAHEVVSIDRLDGVPAEWAEHTPFAFAVRRFDRRRDGTRVHHEDLCQALTIRPAHKYGNTGGRRVGLHGALRLVADACGEADARSFTQRIGFVVASGNGDAHLKNWSLEWGSADRPRLSPLYDQVCTVRWPAFGWSPSKGKGPEMGLGLAAVRHFAQVDTALLDDVAARSGQPWAAEEVAAGIQRAVEGWDAVGELAPEAMRAALAEHWARVPLLRRFGWKAG